MTTEAVEHVEHLEVPLNLNIYPSEKNPRKTFNEKDDAELKESLENKGQIEEIKLRKTKIGYEIVDGQRRWQEVKKLSATFPNEWKTIKAEVSGIDDFEAQNIRLIVLFMRKGVIDQELEAAVYSHYLDGRTKGIFIGRIDSGFVTDSTWEDRGFSEMHRQTGIRVSLIASYVGAARERGSLERSLGEELTKKISASDLLAVRVLKAKNERLWLQLLQRRATRELKTKHDLDEAVKIIKEAPSDVAQAVAEGTLDTGYAEQIAKVDNPDEREKLIREAVNIKDEQKKDEKRFQAAVKKIEEGDIDLTEEQREERINALKHDQHVLRDIQKMYLDAKATVRVTHILAISNPEKMQECFRLVHETAKIFEEVAACAPRDDGREGFLEVYEHAAE